MMQHPIHTDDREVFIFPTSLTQTKLWFLDRLQPNSSAYNINSAYRFTGILNVEALEKSLFDLVHRHESLRTNFALVDGSPQQLVSSEVEFSLPIVDLQHLPENQREIKAQSLAQKEAQTPFNLERDRLFRCQLLRLAPEDYILLVTLHHIISDGWSMGVFERELTTLYPAFVSGKPSPLPELSIQYPDFAVWQKDWLQGEVLETLLDYWKQQLGGQLPILELHTDRPHPPIQTDLGAACFLEIPQHLKTEIQQLSRHYGVTLFMTLLTVYKILLYRYTAQEDIIIGTPIASRNRVELEGLIGFFANTLALRTDLSGNPSFSELLGRVRDVALAAYEHQDMPFEQLVAELKPDRDLSRSPIFQVVFSLQNTPKSTVELPGLTLSSLPIEQTSSKFDLTLELAETTQGMKGKFIYNTDLFDSTTIERMSGHYLTLLEGIVANPSQKICQFPLLTEAERHQILVEWNDTAANYPEDRCIHQLFEEQVERTPDAIAVVFENQKLTYRELNDRANQLARYLQHLGIQPETLVGLYVERSLAMIIGLLGILKAGGAYVPLDPTYPQERLNLILDDARVPVLVTQNSLLSNFPQTPNFPTICVDTDWQEIARFERSNPISEAKPDNLAYVIYTSGSTGKPKGVLVPHRGLCNIAVADKQRLAISETSRVLQFASLSFDASVWETILTLCSGARLYLSRRESVLPGLGLQVLLQQKEITHMIMPPSALAVLSPENLPALQVAIAGAETCGADVVKKWSVGGHRFFNAYGPTEATIYCTFAEWTSKTGKPPIGRPIANTQTYILDPHLQPVPIGVAGELCIGGVGVTRGYLNRPELTAEKFIPNPFGTGRLYKTGDLARYLPDGNIEFIDRLDRQVKIRGFRIELGEIEAVLSQHPQVEEVVVISREDRPGDKYLAAYIVPNQKSVPSVDELRQFLKQKLPAYMIPAAFVPLEALPLNPNGKIDRKSLPAPDWQQQTPTSFVAPRNSIEQQLAEIWAKVLWREQPVGIHDNFFDLGGHSLLAVRLVAEIENSFKTKLPLAALFQLNTVAELAEFLAESKPEIENLEPETHSSQEVKKAEETRIIPPLAPDIHHQLLALTAGWKGQRVTPESLIFGLNTQGLLPPLFWCFQGFRELSQLAKYIGAEQPIYGMRSGHLMMTYTQENLQALAAHYVREILKIQPEGSFRLGGNCQSGSIMFEIAQQLQQQGKTVAILCLLEAFIPKPYFGEVALFYGRESDRFNPYKAFTEPELGYRKFYRGGFSINIVSGDHGQYFNEPNIQVFAGKLRETLDRVQSNEGAILSEEAYRSQISTIPSLTLQSGETRSFAVTVRNISSVTWLATEKSGIFLANHWLDENGEIVRWLDSRVTLDRDLPPKASIDLEITVKAPKETGQYLLELDLVEEGVTWFKQKGSDTAVLQVMVTANTEEKGNFDRIEPKVEIDISQSPTSNESPNSETLPYRQLGDDRFEKGDFVGAIEFYQKAIKSDPNQPFELYLNLGKALSATSQIAEAIACYQTVIQEQPNFPDVYWNLGNLQRQQGKLKKAIASYKTALELDNNLAWIYPILGDTLAKSGQFEAAIANYKTALNFEKDNPNLYFKLGKLFFQKGDIAEAIERYRQAIEFNLEGVGAYVRLGDALSQQENFEEAIATYQQAISRHPSNSYAYQMLGNAQKQKGDIEAAISSYQSAVKYHQNPPFGVYRNLGDSLSKVGKNQEAIAAYQKAQTLQPENPGIYRSLGNILCEIGDREGAIDSYQKAIAINPQQPFIIYQKLGDLFSQKKQREAAIDAYQKALELQPKNPLVRKALEKLESGETIS